MRDWEQERGYEVLIGRLGTESPAEALRSIANAIEEGDVFVNGISLPVYGINRHASLSVDLAWRDESDES